jgi:hypothetical protein
VGWYTTASIVQDTQKHGGWYRTLLAPFASICH